jgi:hypothetical protein
LATTLFESKNPPGAVSSGDVAAPIAPDAALVILASPSRALSICDVTNSDAPETPDDTLFIYTYRK